MLISAATLGPLSGPAWRAAGGLPCGPDPGPPFPPGWGPGSAVAAGRVVAVRSGWGVGLTGVRDAGSRAAVSFLQQVEVGADPQFAQ